MIKRADDRDIYPNMTAAKPRATGVQPVSRLVELLIKQYEIQDELRQQKSRTKRKTAGAVGVPVAEMKTDRATQATFTWFE